MKVYVYPADRFACGHYRLIWPAEELRKQGYDVTIVDPNSRDLNVFFGKNEEIEKVTYPFDADVLVFQRTTHRHLVAAIAWLIANTKLAIIIDVDDDLAAVHPSNAAFFHMHPRIESQTQHSWQHLQRACRIATLVTVSTPALAQRYAPHGRAHVLHNHVPGWWLALPHADSPVIGWPGSLHSHPNDPSVLRSALGRLVRSGAAFRVIGRADGMQKAFQLDQYEPEGTGDVDFPGWPFAVSQLGIGIAPLADTRFNAAKSWLKPLEMSALGVPWVGSPLPEYRALHKRGCGLLAKDAGDWYKQLNRLVQSQDLRDELSEAGKNVARSLTIEQNIELWWDAWEHALQSRK